MADTTTPEASTSHQRVAGFPHPGRAILIRLFIAVSNQAPLMICFALGGILFSETGGAVSKNLSYLALVAAAFGGTQGALAKKKFDKGDLVGRYRVKAIEKLNEARRIYCLLCLLCATAGAFYGKGVFSSPILIMMLTATVVYVALTALHRNPRLINMVFSGDPLVLSLDPGAGNEGNTAAGGARVYVSHVTGNPIVGSYVELCSHAGGLLLTASEADDQGAATC